MKDRLRLCILMLAVPLAAAISIGTVAAYAQDREANSLQRDGSGVPTSPDCTGRGDSILGYWFTSDRDSKIEIVRHADSTYSGRLVWVRSPNNSFEGVVILKDVKYDRVANNYICPWVYDPKLNITAHATATIVNDTLYLKAQKGFFTRREFFTR